MIRQVAAAMGVASVLALGACAVAPPPGPSFAAIPGQGKSYDQFAADDARCRQIALNSSGTTPAEGATQSAVGSAAVGTVLGAAAGALLGAAAGNAGTGAAIGAGAGLLGGSAVGAGNAAASGAALQQRYDDTYAQCMVAAGNRVRGFNARNEVPPVDYAPPPVAYEAPPPVYYAPPPAVVYAPPPVVYAPPPPAVTFGFGFGGGYHRHWW